MTAGCRLEHTLHGCVFFMAKVISTLSDYIGYVNTLYNYSSTAPTAGDEDYTVWTSLANIAVSLWERERGMLWNELFVKLTDAATGDKTTAVGDYSYALPSDFRFPASGIVWLGSNTNKTAYKVIKMQDLQAYENDMGYWCYFMMDGSPTLEFNPNLTFSSAQTINYAYYKYASQLTTGSSTFEMSDPMFSVYFALSELKKEEGNIPELTIAKEKLDAMATLNEMPTWLQDYSLTNMSEPGFNT